jgi:hypothetical protein
LIGYSASYNLLIAHDLSHFKMWGPQQKSPRNCLSKTQVSANTKVDV